MLYDSIDDKNLNRSLWILKNISKIRFIVRFIFISIALVIYGFLGYNVYMLIISHNQHIALYNDFLYNRASNTNNILNGISEITPIELTVHSQGASTGFGKNYYDFYAYIENTNEKYKVDSFKYHFVYDSNYETAIESDFIPVNSDKYVFARGVNGANNDMKDIKLVIDDVHWKLIDLEPTRASNHFGGNVPYDCEITDSGVEVSNEKIKNTKSGNKEVNTFSFDVYNDSLNNYKKINVKIIFFNRSGDIVYSYEKEVENLRSRKTASSSINLPEHLDDISSVLTIPDVDMCNQDSYMPEDIINTGV